MHLPPPGCTVCARYCSLVCIRAPVCVCAWGPAMQCLGACQSTASPTPTHERVFPRVPRSVCLERLGLGGAVTGLCFGRTVPPARTVQERRGVCSPPFAPPPPHTHTTRPQGPCRPPRNPQSPRPLCHRIRRRGLQHAPTPAPTSLRLHTRMLKKSRWH